MTKIYCNLEDAAAMLGHGRHYFRRNPDIALAVGAFVVEGDFKHKLLFVRAKVEALAGTLPAKRPAPFKVKRVTLPVYREAAFKAIEPIGE